MKHYRHAMALMEQARRLVERAHASDNYDEKCALLAEAEQLYLEAKNLTDQPVRWLGLGRHGWIAVQWSLGLLNAWNLVDALDKGTPGDYLAAFFSACSLLLIAAWRLPPK